MVESAPQADNLLLDFLANNPKPELNPFETGPHKLKDQIMARFAVLSQRLSMIRDLEPFVYGDARRAVDLMKNGANLERERAAGNLRVSSQIEVNKEALTNLEEQYAEDGVFAGHRLVYMTAVAEMLELDSISIDQ